MQKGRRVLGLLAVLSTAFVVFWACKKEPSGNSGDNFDRKQMLTNYADNLIIPAYTELKNQVDDLKLKSDAFLSNPNITNLNELRQVWRFAYGVLQQTNAYNFGPAGESGLKKSAIEEIGVFPVKKDSIEARINRGVTVFNDFSRDTRGFLTLDYLIFDLESNDQKILDRFTADANAKNYLNAVVNHLKTYVDGVVTSWNGDYRATFIESNGTSVGSSTSSMYNEFVKSFESIKNIKLGLPLGKRPGQTQTEPTLVEGYYSGQSVLWMKIHFESIVKIWKGVGKNGTDGIGFKEYLLSVEGGEALVASTEAQIKVLEDKLALLPADRLSDQVNNNAVFLDSLYTELQKHTRFFKSDMSSLLGIAITYSSGDGD